MTIFAFGVLGLVCFVFGILAWIMGAGDLKAMRSGHLVKTGRGLTRAGWILGILGVCIGAVLIILLDLQLLIFAVFLFAAENQS